MNCHVPVVVISEVNGRDLSRHAATKNSCQDLKWLGDALSIWLRDLITFCDCDIEGSQHLIITIIHRHH